MLKAKELRAKQDVGYEDEIVSVVYEFDSGARSVRARRMDEFNPIAQNLRDLVSAKQSGVARFLAESAGLNENEVADDLYGCEFNELSKPAASMLIDYLEDHAVNFRANLRLAG